MTEPSDWVDSRERNPRYMKGIYPIYRLDKNILWFNVNGYWMGLIYGVVTFEFIRKWYIFKKRLLPGKIWLPIVDGRKWI